MTTVPDDASGIPEERDYGATATLMFNSKTARLVGPALQFANEHADAEMDAEDSAMLGLLAVHFMTTAAELAS